MQKSLEISMKKFQGKKLSKSYCSFSLDDKSISHSSSHILTPILWIPELPPKWSITWSDTASEMSRSTQKRGNNVDITNIFNYGKDTIHKRMELFLSAPKNPIIDLKVKGKKTYMWSLGNKRGREKISSKIRHQYRLKRKVKLTLQR